jgi:hypothetical protein
MIRITVLGLVMGALTLIPSSDPAVPVAPEETVICLWCSANLGEHWFWVEAGECGEPSGGKGEHLHGESGTGATGGAEAICARCGGTSQCHDYNMSGPCHLPCDLDTQGSALIAEAISTLERSIEAGAAAPAEEVSELLALVGASPSARFDPGLGAVLMLDCQGTAVGQWKLPAGVPETVHIS